ncbi:MAG TPA: hypothetical protein VNY52_07600 [Solirubrobacteraceae bacterium]|jgi:phosphatidylethanolamine-binding protein (PEBP) family uncharacterized protein|nr:hypothetical protein [Solirubrobacteraceae bacterium]
MQGRVLKRGVFARAGVGVRVSVLALVVLAAGVLAGCGGSSSPSAGTAAGVPSSPAAAAQASASNVDAVARVATTPIAKSSYEHWLSVEKALGVTHDPSHQALGFLITSDWVLAEAAARGISVSAAEVKQRLAQIERQSFPQAGSLRKFLARSGESDADLLARVRVELLESRIAAKVTAGKSGSQSKAVLVGFQQAFKHRWKGDTTCGAGYVMEDCSEYRGGPENLTVAGSSSNSSSGRSGSGSAGHSASGSTASSSNSSSSSSGEVYSRPGSFAITSPAFERNGSIPAQYTCDGAGVSPPLQWSNVPSKAAAFVLFVIDDTATGPASGVRWIVGDISPTAQGVAAGGTPAGGIVGSDTQGHGGYGGICPAHGKTSTIEFVLYALSKKIPLSPGFQPAVAEREYGAGKLLLGEPAVTYAVYHRP